MRVRRKDLARSRRHRRVRKKAVGTAERPRLSVFRSNKHIYGQIIDDTQGRVLASVSTLSKGIREELRKGKTNQGKLVGLALAKGALEKDVRRVVFDRGGYKYHGRVKALADGAREGGMEF